MVRSHVVEPKRLRTDYQLLPSDSRALRQLLDVADQLAATQASLANDAAHLALRMQSETERSDDEAWRSAVEPLATGLHRAAHTMGDPVSLAPRDLPATMRVALLGRTEAGKSTLVNALMGGEVAQVGDGRQRTTRRMTRHQLTPRIELIDTPGLAAVDGEEDEHLAAAGAAGADVVLYLVNSDQFGAAEAAAATRVVPRNRPLILVLNVKRDIDGRRKGRSFHAKRRAFLDDPDTVFQPDALRDHQDRVAEAAPELWERARRELRHVHALAAAMAAEEAFSTEADELYTASRVPELLDQLEHLERTWFAAMRVTRLFEPLVGGTVTAGDLLTEATAHLGGIITTLRREEDATDVEIQGLVSRHVRLLGEDLQAAFDPVRDLIPEIVSGKDPREAIDKWQDDLPGAEVEDLLRRRLETLADELSTALGHEVEADGDLVWSTPTIRFDDTIDMAEIVLDALGGSLERAGSKVRWKIASKLLFKGIARTASKGGAGGAVTVVLAALTEVALFMNSIRVGRTKARRQQRAALRDVLRDTMDGLGVELRRHFTSAIRRGSLGTAIEEHREHLQQRRYRMENVVGPLRDLHHAVVELRQDQMTRQVAGIAAVVGGSELPQLQVDRSSRGVIETRGARQPSAGLATAAFLLGVHIDARDDREDGA